MSLLDNLNRYEISERTGFLPAGSPLHRLPTYYSPWETVGSSLPQLIATKTLQNAVDGLPLLSTDTLKSVPEARRAYIVLSFIASGLLFGSSTTLDV